MSTFIGQLIGFAVIVFLLWRYVVPPVRRLMTNQQDAVRKQLAESAEAKKKLEEATRAHEKALAEAKEESKVIVEEARADAERIAEQLREQADAEVERVKVQGEKQIQLLRAQLIRQLRQDLGTESVHRAGELVREHVADDDARSATVDRFIDELDEMAPSDAVARSGVTGKLRSASRESLSATVKQFEEVCDDLDADGLSTLADELAAVVKLLIREPILTRHLAEPAENPDHKTELVDRLLAGKIGEPALKVVRAAACNRWSDSSDLIRAFEHVARLPLLVRADRDDEVAAVEEQLFRFGRILFGKPRLDNLLSDFTAPAEGRVKLLKDVLGGAGDVNPVTAALLSQTVELLHGRRFDEAVMELNELAVSRRGEVIAHVKAATELSDAQRERLTEVLSRVYRHPVSLQLEIAPAVLGGLSISVGDEVIDGTLSSRLARAQTQLPD